MIQSIKVGIFSLLSFVLFFIFPTPVLAMSLSILGATPATITDKEQVVEINLSIENLPAGDSYFRAGWKQGNSYVGYVQNNDGSWIKLRSLDDGCTDYYHINEATTSAILRIKIGGDNEISNGNISIRAHRYTSTCGSTTASNEFATLVNLPTPTPTETATSTPVSTNTPTSAPSATKTPSPTPLKTSTIKPTSSPEVLAVGTSSDSYVLGLRDQLMTSEPTSSSEATSKNLPILPIVLIVAGVACIVGASFAFFKKVKTGYTDTYENESGKDS